MLRNMQRPRRQRRNTATPHDGVDAVAASIRVRLRVPLRVFFEVVVPWIADAQRLAALDDRFGRINAWNRHPQAVAKRNRRFLRTAS